MWGLIASVSLWQDICSRTGDIVRNSAEGHALDKALKRLENSTSGDFVSEVLGLEGAGKATDMALAYPEGCDFEQRTAELARLYADWALS